MGVAITIRNVPQEVRDELAARAARSGRSLQEYLALRLQELTARPDVDDVVARIRERVRSSGTSVAAAEILAALDTDRR